MAKKLKEYYDQEYLVNLADKISKVTDKFDKFKFLELTIPRIDKLEFTPRQELVARALHEYIDIDYVGTLNVFSKILGPELNGNYGAFSEGWWLWPIGKYVENYGAEYFIQSTDFSKELTKRFTGEYCMRPILQNYPQKTFELLKIWSTDENERVRRLSSECMRIRLPWARKTDIALQYFDDFVEVLDNLKNDPDKYIQKSVANNLNDLYKEDPEKFVYIVDKWESPDMTKETEWIIKHGSRTKNKDN
ncbi:DNA alkylation repair protein [Anaerococcus martiniensis]|uniref:DNA alkylation repair protein n=1 Tax=Anaerococcus sp. WGS1579 TaxID=3366809 RepID=UPI00372D674C